MRAGLGIRSGLRRLVGSGSPGVPPVDALGAPSRFTEGDWVRVLDEDGIRATLDERSRLRGLEFGKQQWFSCGRTYRVSKVVRRLIDDGGTLRLVSGTVLLDDVHCGGEHEAVGCGRLCPMMYRDEWLEAASPPVDAGSGTRDGAGSARVRPIAEIERGLDFLGRRDALLFMPEMARYAGRTFPIHRRIDRVWEFEDWIETPSPFYILEGVRCSGAVLGEDGPCHRSCHILWHRDWLEVD